jgi:precorrin-8X/cobalt-precorrin-8 methylmutase
VNTVTPEYDKDPASIEERSFGIIRKTLSCYAVEDKLLDVVIRVVHAGGDFSLASLIESRNGGLDSAMDALVSGGRIFCDVEMLKAGISRKECARLGLDTVCFIGDEGTVERASRNRVTRAMASVDIAVERGVRVFAFGNAPSALFRLLEHAGKGAPVDFVCGMPVGFVGAADSKEALRVSTVPSILLRGPRGGSGLCAACINALLRMA